MVISVEKPEVTKGNIQLLTTKVVNIDIIDNLDNPLMYK